MPKKLTETQRKELEYQKDWCLTIHDFILKKHGELLKNHKELVKELEAHDLLAEFRNTILEEYQQQNIRGLRLVSRDLKEWAGGLSESFVAELNLILKEKFNKCLPGSSMSDPADGENWG